MARKPPNTNANRIYFTHLRYDDENGGLDPHGGVTIAFRRVADQDASQWEVAVARCNPCDTFNKKVGRSIATGYLAWNRCWLLTTSNTALKDIVEEVFQFVQNKLEIGETAREAEQATIH